MMDAELSSPGLGLDQRPDRQIRKIARDKSVLLTRAGFQAMALGLGLADEERTSWDRLWDIAGEILWILDDLADVEEDLSRETWNRVLWGIWDEIGEQRFRLGVSEPGTLQAWLEEGDFLNMEINEMVKRVQYLAEHPSTREPDSVWGFFGFWVTSWMGIYR